MKENNELDQQESRLWKVAGLLAALASAAVAAGIAAAVYAAWKGVQ